MDNGILDTVLECETPSVDFEVSYLRVFRWGGGEGGVRGVSGVNRNFEILYSIQTYFSLQEF